MNCFKITLLLLTTMTHFIADSSGASKKEFQEIREEVLSTNQDESARNETKNTVLLVPIPEEVWKSLIGRNELPLSSYSLNNAETALIWAGFLPESVKQKLKQLGRNELTSGSLEAREAGWMKALKEHVEKLNKTGKLKNLKPPETDTCSFAANAYKALATIRETIDTLKNKLC
uniref:Pardosin 5a 14* Pardocin 13f n=1 Tax=Pardosa amentata TaxID=75001 RepID=A0A8D7ZRN4_9ARAC|nr:Pardosin 5a 14* Pardocin 13f precursor [Pardosa amentata]